MDVQAVPQPVSFVCDAARRISRIILKCNKLQFRQSELRNIYCRDEVNDYAWVTKLRSNTLERKQEQRTSSFTERNSAKISPWGRSQMHDSPGAPVP